MFITDPGKFYAGHETGRYWEYRGSSIHSQCKFKKFPFQKKLFTFFLSWIYYLKYDGLLYLEKCENFKKTSF